MLIGNKSDLESRRNVSYEEGQRFARENNLLFTECSAKTANNVEKAFLGCSEFILEKIKEGTVDVYSEISGVRLGPNKLGENV